MPTETAETLENPVLPEDSLKRMAEIFKREYQPTKATPDPAPEPKPEPAKSEPKQEPTAAAPKPEGDDEHVDTSRWSQSARENFERLAQSRKELKRQTEEGRKALEQHMERIKNLEAEIGKYKALPVDPSEWQKTKEERDRLAKENQQAIEQLETLNLERSPRFQNWWNTETGKYVKRINQIVPADKRDEIAKLVMEPASLTRDAAIEEITNELSTTTKDRLRRAMDGLDEVKAQREEALQKGSERYKELQEHEKAEKQKAEQMTKQRREQLAAAAMAKAEMLDAFKERPDDKEDAAEIPARKAFVKAMISGEVDEDVMLAVPGMAVEGLYYKNKVVPSLRAEIAKRDELIKQLQGASPKPSEGAAATSKREDQEPGNEFARKIRELMRP